LSIKLFILRTSVALQGLEYARMRQKPTTSSEFRELFAAWIRHHAKEKGLSDGSIAEALGVSRPSFNKLKNGKRTAKHEEAAKLSQLFSADPPTQLKLAPQHPVRKLVSLRQNVVANVWRRNEVIMPTGLLSVLQFPNEKYDNCDQFAHYVEDEHANGYVPKNFYVICVNYSEARSAPLHGDMVVIERYRTFTPEEGGDLTETTIRRLAKRGDRWLLESVSTDRARYPDIAYGGDAPHLKILGLIIARYAPD
jgi:transcriptional regulator with XRE-family HTH domain